MIACSVSDSPRVANEIAIQNDNQSWVLISHSCCEILFAGLFGICLLACIDLLTTTIKWNNNTVLDEVERKTVKHRERRTKSNQKCKYFAVQQKWQAVNLPLQPLYIYTLYTRVKFTCNEENQHHVFGASTCKSH